MLGWFKKKLSSPPPAVIPPAHRIEPTSTSIEWDPDAYKSARFLMGMYAGKVPPFSQWRAPGTNISAAADSTAEICAQSFQLIVWFWRFEDKFGPLAGKMARDAFLLVAEELAPENNFSGMLEWLLNLHDDARKSFSEMPEVQRHISVNGTTVTMPYGYFVALYFFLQLEGSPYKDKDSVDDDDCFALAECVEHAKFAANTMFDPMLAAIPEFRPEDFLTWRWGDKPGAHEMQLMRRHNNPLFAPARQIVTSKDVYEARQRDVRIWNAAVDEVVAIRKELQETDFPPNWQDFLGDIRDRIDELLPQVHRLGSNSKLLEEHLNESRLFISDTWIGAYKNQPETQALYAEADKLHYLQQATMYGTQWLAQIGNPEGIIPPDEVVAAFLCQSIEEVRETVRILEADTASDDGGPSLRTVLLQMRSGTLDVVKPLLRAGHELPGIREKLDILGVAV